MPTREDFIKEVGEFLVTNKSLAGIGVPQQWQPSRRPTELCVKIPIEAHDAQSGQSLVIEFTPASQGLEFSISIVCGVGICRLDFDETGGHTNTIGHLDGLPPVVNGSHFHRWEHNSRFVESYNKLPELKTAEEIPATIHTFDAALRWFCDETQIQLPHNHHIELPPKVLI